jgi:hypothetical protein
LAFPTRGVSGDLWELGCGLAPDIAAQTADRRAEHRHPKSRIACRRIIPLSPSLIFLAFVRVPNWVEWLAVPGLASALGAVLGGFLDILDMPVPRGLGSDWTKLLSVMLGLVGLGIFVRVVVIG